MEFKRELLFEVMPQVGALLRDHFEELTLHKEVVKLNPRWDEYAALERAGRFVIFTARDDGELVGYNAFFVGPHLHYADLKVAHSDVFYVVPHRRKGATALRLLRYSEVQLKNMGVMKTVYHCKLSNNFSNILNRMDYSIEEMMMGKML